MTYQEVIEIARNLDTNTVQPEGAQVAEAYGDDPCILTEALYAIAYLLHELNKREIQLAAGVNWEGLAALLKSTVDQVATIALPKAEEPSDS